MRTPAKGRTAAGGRAGFGPRALPALVPPLTGALLAVAAPSAALAQAPGAGILYRSPAFTVTDTSVRQGTLEAVALGRDTIVSSYPRAAREVHYKFSLNGQDNEFRPGTEHVLNVRPVRGAVVAPVRTFGVESPPYRPTPEEAGAGEEGTAQVTIRLDLRPVLRSFAARGHYDPPQGPRIRAADFTGAYVLGDVAPLSWSTEGLAPGSPRQLTDPDGDSVYTVTLPFPAEYTRPLAADGRAVWGRSRDLAGLPVLRSPQRLLDAVHRLSLEELTQLVREDGALSAGAKWPGVWTRDVAFSAVLSLALVAPDAVRASLLAKVDAEGRIIQDTGTGGSWPMSTDRQTWALAAWELYAATGDRDWLRRAYDVIARSAEADRHAAFDVTTGLMRGESSFLDWREQSYPRWMDPKDIYQGQALGTNAVHLGAHRILADMARALGDEPAARGWAARADTLQAGMRAHLWIPERGWFGQYRYGRNALALSPRAEAVGEVFSVVYGAATPEQAATLSRSVPLVPFGTPAFWPYIAGEPFYHNATIWPFVTAFWTWAAADAGNTAAVEHGLANLTRAAALFLTNKENMVASTGHFEGTALNSDRQLWSVAGNLAATYRVLFGMRLLPDRLAFRPMVPRAYAGERMLAGVRWRAATLDVTVRGFGNGVARARLDGRELPAAELPAGLAGRHTVELELNGSWPEGAITLVENRFAPATPRAELAGGTLRWQPVPGAVRYVVHRDAQPVATTTATAHPVTAGSVLAEWQVLAVDSAGVESYLSEPQRAVTASGEQVVQPPAALLERQHAGHTGGGYVTLERTRNVRVEIPVRVPAAGTYAVDARYANGNGPVNTEDKAGIRTLLVDADTAGVLVMPQRGSGRWSDWGYTNPVRVRLSAGAHRLAIVYTPLDANMNRLVNTALLDHVRLTRLPDDGAVAAPPTPAAPLRVRKEGPSR